jgi:hypothetical protein
MPTTNKSIEDHTMAEFMNNGLDSQPAETGPWLDREPSPVLMPSEKKWSSSQTADIPDLRTSPT